MNQPQPTLGQPFWPRLGLSTQSRSLQISVLCCFSESPCFSDVDIIYSLSLRFIIAVSAGRSGNAWISPIGSMMFSTSLPLPSNTRLSSHLPLLQHIVAVAVVYAIRSLPGYEEVPVRIKWPNDIYYKSQVKLGGILVSCISIGSGLTQSAIIGNIRHNGYISSYWDKERLANLAKLSIVTTVEPPIKDPPRRGQPLQKGQFVMSHFP